MWTRSDGGGQNIFDVLHEWSLVVAAAHGGAVGGLALGDRRRGGGRGRAAVWGVRRTALLAAPEMCKSLCQFHLPTKNKIGCVSHLAAFPLVLLVSEMKVKALTRMERKVKGGGSRESLSKNWIPVLARAYLRGYRIRTIIFVWVKPLGKT